MRKYLDILKYGRRNVSDGVMAVLCMVMYNIFGVFSLALIIPFLEILFGKNSSESLPLTISEQESLGLRQQLFYKLDVIVSQHPPMQVLVWICIVLGICIFLKNVFRYLSSYFFSPLEQGVIFEIRQDLYRHLAALNLKFFGKEKKGNIVNIMISDVQIIQESVIGTLQNVLTDPITMLLYLGTMIFISWKLTLFTLIVLPITGIFINWISKSLRDRARKGQDRQGRLMGLLDEFIGGIRIVKAFGGEDYEKKRYAHENDSYRHLMISLKRRGHLASPMTEILSIGVVLAIILYGGSMILKGGSDLEASAFIGFIALFSQFLAPIKTLSNSISKVQKGIASYDRILEFLDSREHLESFEDDQHVVAFENEIELQNLSFGYGERQVLKGINLSLKKGEMVALVGPSGGGKSTLVDLLPRFYEPTQGQVLMDGTDIRKVSLKGLRKLFGIVTQEGILFHDTIMNNIAYGDLKPDEERVIQAAKIANAHTFITETEDGYESIIGERGSLLSGGQRQRISIARALYQNPPILILDEATSALDSESEKQLQIALEALMQNRTSIVIAHRLSTITTADRILFIQDGKIIEEGTHTELLELNGAYRRLYDIQLSELTGNSL